MGRWRSFYSRASTDVDMTANNENSYTTTALPEHKNGGTEVAVIATVPVAANGLKKDKDATNGSWHAPGDAVTDPLNPVTAVVDDGDLDDVDLEEMQCGLGPCTPRWMQIFASKQAFLATFCITWVLQGMYYTYFVSVITTIEKLFQIQSKTTGLIMSATEIGQIGSSLLLTYYGGQGHRPKWIAWGMVLFAVSSFTCSMPHFIFGKQLIHANDLLFSGVVSTHAARGGSGGSGPAPGSELHTMMNTSEPVPPNICRAPSSFAEHLDEDWDSSKYNSSVPWSTRLKNKRCEEETGQVEQRIHSKITTIVLAIFFISLLGVGMGQTAVYTLGIPYIDDNVASRESPLYFAITIGVRILGPALGFILGSLCTRLYADLSVDPQITPSDPRWVGAWWLGLVLVSSMLMLASLAMFSFPKRLSTSRPTPRALRREKKNPSLRDFPKAVKRLLHNDILMCRTASSVLHILPIAGIYTFLPKYIESQFRMPAHSAAMISGVGGILVMGLGIIISGVFILRVKPNARFVAAWIAFTALVYAVGMGVLMFIGCPMDDFAGLMPQQQGLPKFEPVCNRTCDCDQDKFSPICGADGRTYFSACHAGCTNITIDNGKIVEYSDCQCLYPNATGAFNPGDAHFPAQASIGYCGLKCGNFIWYILLFSLFVFIHSTSEVGSMLLILRCVDPRDKAMALGLIQFAIGLFGNVPCPIVYGAVVDSACLVWETACGKQGACWLYDASIFRMFYHGTTGAIMLCAFFVDLVVWYKSGSINFVDEQAPTPSQEEELNPIATCANGNGSANGNGAGAKARSETSV
ncbi:solute carrier organic anion transporter family member 74D-like [Thrips palmi]|uniref:Solute carrier organic anion transporter family member n=1 Tax=Thrips palmi TaxID=161013 RepID=A0A6P8YRP1_THRPL|nr:solute carrier organic anion transporter family member 74D-like [Thrips palmi]